MENKNSVRSRTRVRKFDKATFIVTTHFNENGQETAEDKLARIVSDRIIEELKTPVNAAI